MITFDYIQQQYQKILAEITAEHPLAKWKVKPAGIELTSHKSVHGYATPKGIIQINKAYLGTKAFTKLSYTLRHEFTHLAIGLSNNHNALFRRVERYFGVDIDRNLTEEIDMVKANISYKYQLMAHLVNGTTFNLGGDTKRGYVVVRCWYRIAAQASSEAIIGQKRTLGCIFLIITFTTQ